MKPAARIYEESLPADLQILYMRENNIVKINVEYFWLRIDGSLFRASSAKTWTRPHRFTRLYTHRAVLSQQESAISPLY